MTAKTLLTYHILGAVIFLLIYFIGGWRLSLLIYGGLIVAVGLIFWNERKMM